MCSGSQTELLFENIPFVSEDDLELVFEMSSSSSDSGSCSPNLSRPERVAPQVQPIQPIKTITRARAPRLLHGRSPLGLATPIHADDLAVVARPARVLQLVSDELHITQTARGMPSTAVLKTEPPVELPSPTIARIRSMRRKRETETPLVRCIVKALKKKFHRRRVVELVGQGIARRFDSRRSQ